MRKSLTHHKRKFFVFSILALLIVGLVLKPIHLSPKASTANNAATTSNSSSDKNTSSTSDQKDVSKTPSAYTPDGTVNSKDIRSKNIATSPNDKTSSTKNNVNVFITYASQNGENIEVDSYVSGTTEDGGTCTLILSKNGEASITKTTTAVSDVSTTACPAFYVKKSTLSTGTWLATVSYSSSKSEGNSSPTNIEVVQ